jgi:endonuclease/exonuclease/phosphatase family metal-dependent hydrolase
MTDPVTFRVLAYNVRGLRDDQDALAQIVREADPDVVCVQEAPKYLRWRTKGAALARHWGLLYVSGGGSTGGTALYAHLRVDVDDAREQVASRLYGWPDRGIATAMVRKGGARLAVASLHVPFKAAAREHYSDLVRELLDRYPTSHRLVAGDLNQTPSGRTWTGLRELGLVDLDPQCGPTFPAAAPETRIDGILATGGVHVVEHRVIDAPAVVRASDHRPLLAVVTVPVDEPTGAAAPTAASGGQPRPTRLG